MTVEEPPQDVKDQVDWSKLAELADRAYALGSAGRLTPAAYDDLWKAGLEASGNRPELLEGLARWKP